MKITISEGKALIETPYNAQFVSALKSKVGGARWDAASRRWSVPAESAPAVREIMRSVFGQDDTQTVPAVTVRLTFGKSYNEYRTGITFLGKTICRAFGRDSGAKVEPGAVFVEGGCDSGGSARNWTTVIHAGSVVELTGIPATMAEHASDELPSYITCEVVEAPAATRIDRSALEAERAALLKRLDEINALLGEEERA